MIGFFIMGQPYAVLLGVLMGICDILPNFGSGTVMLPWAVIALATGNTEKAVMLGVTVAVVGITRNMIYPQVMGSQTGLSPLLTVITVFVGWKLWGVLGMIIGPIIALIIVKVFQSGIFGGVVSDLKVLFSDISRKLTGLGGDYQ
jgi:predicted PurR-regulated permease PerM